MARREVRRSPVVRGALGQRGFPTGASDITAHSSPQPDGQPDGLEEVSEMTEQQLEQLGNALNWLCDNYTAEYALLALSAVATARSGRHYEVVELPTLSEADKAEIETLAAPENLQ